MGGQQEEVIANLTCAPSAAGLTIDFLRRQVALLIGRKPEDIDDDDDLTAHGLDSIGVMRMANVLRLAGAALNFDDLIGERSLAEWWRRVRLRLEAEGNAAAPEDEVDKGAPFAMAPMQHAYWVGRSVGQVLATGCHYYFEFDGSFVDPARLEAAARRIAGRHGMLRARFLDDGRQEIMPESAWRGLAVHDLVKLDEKERERSLAAIRERETHRRLAVEEGRPFDVQLSLLGKGRTRLHLNVDMLACDALSFRLVIDEMARLYGDPESALPPIGYSYPRYLARKTALGSADRARAKAYWQGRLDELSGAPQLPLATKPALIAYPRTVRREHRISAQAWRVLSERARNSGVTLPMALLAAYAEVLGAWSADPSFVINVPLFDRAALSPEVDRLVGDFTSSVLLAVDMSEEVGFLERVRRLQSRFRADAAHAAYPGVAVLRDLARARAQGTGDAASVVFTSAVGMGDLFGSESPRRFGRLAFMISQTSQVWLDCQVTELEGGLLLNWDAIADLWPEGVLDQMFSSFTGLVDALAGEFSDWRAVVPLLTPPGQLERRAAINGVRRARKRMLLHEGFFRWAEEGPSRLALAWGENGQMSYGALAERVRRLAGVLGRRGIGPGDRVAVTLPKGPAQIVAVLAVLSLGAAYVPIGVDHPPARRVRLYRSAGIRVVIAGAPAVSELPEEFDVVSPEEADNMEGAEAIARSSIGSPGLASQRIDPLSVDPSSIAYVIFTSGSIGQPKAVMVPHAAAMNTIEDVLARAEITAEDRVLSVSSLDFDWSVADIFELLTVGGAVVLCLEDERRDPSRFAALVRRFGVTLWQSVPTLFDMLLTVAASEDLSPSLRLVMLGGDWIGLDLYGRLQEKAPGCRLVGLGGITETAIHITWQEVTGAFAGWRSVPYGLPLANVKCRVVDARGRDCPDWTPGELWVGGGGVSAGYLGDPELTARRFVEHAGERWYRSGDLARFRPDGRLEFLGRADSQVKVGGHRIELGEVTAALERDPRVKRAFVTMTEPPAVRLVAAVAADAGVLDEAPSESLTKALCRELPGYMIPTTILVLDEMPLTANGKIDAGALRLRLAGVAGGRERVGAPPLGVVEERLAAIWRELLGGAVITREDSFFALGGDSLLATRMVGLLREAGLRGFEVRRLFAAPRLADVAATLAAGPADSQRLKGGAGSADAPFPLTEMQLAYWLGRRADFALGGVGSYWYWEFDGDGVDLARLEAGINRLIARHPMLRAVVDEDGRQRVLPDAPRFALPVVEAQGEEKNALGEFRNAMAHRLIDPSRWPLFDIRACRYGEGRVRLGFGFDYIVVDALSIMIVFAELARLYLDLEADLPKIAIGFRDYVTGLGEDASEREAAEAFWRRRIRDLPAAPLLPLRCPPEMIDQARFERISFGLPEKAWRTLKRRAREHDLTATVVLGTAFAETLALWSGQSELTLNLTLFDRRRVHPDIGKVVGEFTSLLLASHKEWAGQAFVGAARAFQAEIAAGIDHRAKSGLSVMRDLARQAGRATKAMPIVFTSMLGVADDLLRLSTPFGEYAGGLSQTPQVWLDNQAIEHEGKLLINWDYISALFPPGMIEAMFSAYRTLLEDLSAAASDWSEPIGAQLPRIQVAARRAANRTEAAFAEGLLHERFFADAVARPDPVALLWGEGATMSYGALAQRALRVAAWLVHKGVRPGDPVALRLPRGPDEIVGVLGVLAAGGVYLPLAADQPPARLERMLAAAGARLVLDDLACSAATPPLRAPVVVEVDSPAYIIFTSGSTGEPKGVVISHRAARNTIDDGNRRFGIGAGDRGLAVSRLDFDLSVYDIFGLLSAGGSLVLLQEGEAREARRWAELAGGLGVSLWNSAPALLEMLLAAASGDAILHRLRLALVSGDWIALDLGKRLARLAPQCRLVGLGGATEAAIWSNFFEIGEVAEDWRSIPYGWPLANQKFRVTNEAGGDCPDWVQGELWIGGAGLALGYRGDLQATREKFIVADGEPWYRTGDLGRYRPDGTLEILGRMDGQAKIAGMRIGYGEIEAALESHVSVQKAVVTAIDGRAIVAGVVPRAGAAPETVAALKAFLVERLPAHMIPRQIVILSEAPLTRNGKVDRTAVARLAAALPVEEAREPPRGAAEEAIAALWAELLKRPRISRDESFFAIGGDSLLATRFVEAAQRRLRFDCSLRQMLEAPTVRELARLFADCSQQSGIPMEEGAL